MNPAPVAPQPLKAFDLLNLFEGFLSAWDHLSERVSAHFDGKQVLKYDDGDDVENIAKYMQTELLRFARAQEALVEQKASEIQLKLYKKQLYAISALIDEQILANKTWQLQQDWLPLMMEYSLFRSRNAGDRLIDAIQQLSEQYEFTEDERALAACYLRVLWLGFDGKLKGDHKTLVALRDKIMLNAQFATFNLQHRKVSEQAYKFNINPSQQSRFAPLSRWKRYAIIAVLSYVIVSMFLWMVLTYPLSTELDTAARQSHSSVTLQESDR